MFYAKGKARIRIIFRADPTMVFGGGEDGTIILGEGHRLKGKGLREKREGQSKLSLEFCRPE